MVGLVAGCAPATPGSWGQGSLGPGDIHLAAAPASRGRLSGSRWRRLPGKQRDPDRATAGRPREDTNHDWERLVGGALSGSPRLRAGVAPLAGRFAGRFGALPHGD